MQNAELRMQELKSWIEVSKDSDFPIQNLPYGIFRTSGGSPRVGTRIGDTVIDLKGLAENKLFDKLDIDPSVFSRASLNDFIALGKPFWKKVRKHLTGLLELSNTSLQDHTAIRSKVLFPVSSVEMMMPVEVGDYTDFYSSIEHARNVGMMFRDPANALLPNWKHLPVGYHGRSSSIVVSGTPIHRPKGQTKAEGASSPEFGPTRQLDFELEVAFITGKKTHLGDSVSTEDAEDHIFGLVLFNDLSARDIQKWEYVPLGPFLGKNFGSVISPWIVALDALEPFRVPGPKQEPEVLPYLSFTGNHNFDINLEAFIKPDKLDEVLVCHSNYQYMYWNITQQLAHQTINGCNINVGDMYASGTLSGSSPDSFGSMLELTWNGTKPLKMPDGSIRAFIDDHDIIIMRGYGKKNGLRIGFGEVSVKILPSKK
jgi:fumarylacetoacetase